MTAFALVVGIAAALAVLGFALRAIAYARERRAFERLLEENGIKQAHRLSREAVEAFRERRSGEGKAEPGRS